MCNSEQSKVPTAPAHGRRRKWVVLCLLLLAFLGAGYFALTHLASRDLEAAQAELDRLDPGWRLEDLDARRVVLPPQQNSAFQIRTVLSLLPKGPNGPKILLPVSAKISPEVLLSDAQCKQVEANLAKVAAALAEARKLKDMPQGQPTIKDAGGLPQKDLPGMYVLAVARLLECDVELACQNKDGDAALDSCRAILNVGRSLDDDPSMIYFVVRGATGLISARTLERALAQTEPSPAALRDCQVLMEAEDAISLVRTVLRHERALINQRLAAMKDGDGGNPDIADGWSRMSPRLKYIPGAFVHACAAALRFMTDMTEATRLPEPEQWRRFRQLNEELKQRPVRELVGVIPLYFINHVGDQARFRCAAAGLAVERYRRQYGRWPDSWAALVRGGFLKKEPLDPFDGKPLRFRQLADGFLVYSIGPNEKDDGGRINHLNPQAGADVGFQLWNVPSRRQSPPESAQAQTAQPN